MLMGLQCCLLIGMTMTNDHAPQEWEIWHARFDFSEGKGCKYRPVIVVDTCEDGSLVMMVTSAGNKLHLDHDYLIRDWQEAGLEKPSIARVDRISEIPAGYLGTSGYIGRLAAHDIAEIITVLAEIAEGESFESEVALASEDDQSAAEETRFIVETPGMVEKLIEAHDESLDGCASTDDLDW